MVPPAQVTATVLTFFKIDDCDALWIPTGWLPKFKVEGETVSEAVTYADWEYT